MRLLVLGGLGDHDQLIRFALPIWRLYGFSPHDEPLFWQIDDEDLDARLDPILAWLDALPEGEQVVILGTSAGGIIAAILLCLRPKRVLRIAAIGSPLNRFHHSRNGLLNKALARLEELLTPAGDSLRARIGSFRARTDNIVQPTYSVLPGAYNEQLPSRGHVWTIALALTIFSGRVAAYLKQG